MIGIVFEYDGYNGKIATENELYYFIREDTNDDLKKGDVVKFQSNNNPMYKYAYHISKIDNQKKE